MALLVLAFRGDQCLTGRCTCGEQLQQGQNSLLLQMLLHVRRDRIIIIRTVRDREARRATSTFTQLLSSEYFCFYVSYDVQSGRQGRQTYRQVGYQADRQAGFQAGRQAGRQADKLAGN